MQFAGVAVSLAAAFEADAAEATDTTEAAEADKALCAATLEAEATDETVALDATALPDDPGAVRAEELTPVCILRDELGNDVNFEVAFKEDEKDKDACKVEKDNEVELDAKFEEGPLVVLAFVEEFGVVDGNVVELDDEEVEPLKGSSEKPLGTLSVELELLNFTKV